MRTQRLGKEDCQVCNGSGFTWKQSERRLCSFCDGAGQLTPDETASRLEGLADVVASLEGNSHGVHDRAQAASAEQTATAEELEGRYIAERGLKAKPGLDRYHLLPQEGGQPLEQEPTDAEEVEIIEDSSGLKELLDGLGYTSEGLKPDRGRHPPVILSEAATLVSCYGFNCIKLADDWQGADFLAYHKDGDRTPRMASALHEGNNACHLPHASAIFHSSSRRAFSSAIRWRRDSIQRKTRALPAALPPSQSPNVMCGPWFDRLTTNVDSHRPFALSLSKGSSSQATYVMRS